MNITEFCDAHGLDLVVSRSPGGEHVAYLDCNNYMTLTDGDREVGVEGRGATARGAIAGLAKAAAGLHFRTGRWLDAKEFDAPKRLATSIRGSV